MSKELMVIKVTESGKKTVSAKELYLGLGLHKAVWSRWYPSNIQSNNFFVENVDWVGVQHNVEGNETLDFAVSIDFAKHIAMMAKTEKSHEYRNYFIECEKQLVANRVDSYMIEDPAERARAWAVEYESKEKIKLENVLIKEEKAIVEKRAAELTETLSSVGDLIQPREGEISLNDVAAQLGCYSVNGKPHGDFIFKILNEIVYSIAPNQDCFSHRSGSTVLTDNYKHNVVLKVGMILSIVRWVTNPLNKHSTKGTTTKYKFLKSSNLSNVYPKPKKIDVKEVF